MNVCVLCGGKTNLFSKKTAEGEICKDCLSMIPISVKLNVSKTEFLKRIHDENLEKKKDFETTASYEGVYIDSIHGMVCICKKGNKEEPPEFHDIFRVTELIEAGLFCTNIKNVGTTTNSIVCDIKFRLKTKDISNEYLIVKGKKCAYKTIGNGKLEWIEPYELSMFRNVFNQMIEDVAFNLLGKLKTIQEMKAVLSAEEESREWAKGVLFIDRDSVCDSETIKNKRNELARIFHPDGNSGFGNTETAAQINKAYKILSK